MLRNRTAKRQQKLLFLVKIAAFRIQEMPMPCETPVLLFPVRERMKVRRKEWKNNRNI
jgi:hypothetical protein